jgi:hypothetical protein
MRIAGFTWDQIARQLGYADKSAACRDVGRALERNQAELKQTTDELRALEAARLDRLQVGLWPAAAQGEVKSAGVVLQIIAQRIKLLNLDASEEERERLREELVRQLGAQAFGVITSVLDGLTLTEEQRAIVPDLIHRAVQKFEDRPKEIEGEFAA